MVRDPSTGWRWPWVVMVLVVGGWIFFGPLHSNRPLFLRDLGLWHYPVLEACRNQGPSGFDVLPMWDSRTGCGRPLAANPAYGLFHPANLLYAVLPFNRAFNLWITLHLLVAGIGMQVLAKRFQLEAAAAWAAAMSFMLGGSVLSCSAQYPMIVPVAWAPMTLAAGLKMAAKPQIRAVAVLAVLLAFQLLGGQPEIAIMTVAIGSSWSVAGNWTSRRWIRLAGWCAACVWACMLAAPQILPAAEYARSSVRSLGFPSSTILYWSFHPARLIEFIVRPNNEWLTIGWQADPLIDGGKALFNSLYVGVVAVGLAIFSVVVSLSRRPAEDEKPAVSTTVVAVTGAVGLMLAFGRYLPGMEIIVGHFERWIPLRYPVKALFLTAVSVPLLAGQGLALASHLVSPRFRFAVTFFLAGAVVLDLGSAHYRMTPVTSISPLDLERPLAEHLAKASLAFAPDDSLWRVYFHRLRESRWGPRITPGEVVSVDLYYQSQQRLMTPSIGLLNGQAYAFDQSIEVFDSLEMFNLTRAMHGSELRVLVRSLGEAGVLWFLSPRGDLEEVSGGELERVVSLGPGIGVPPDTGWLYRVVSYLPRFRLVSEYEVVPEAEADTVVARHRRKQFPPPILLDSDPGIPSSGASDIHGTVTTVAEDGRRVVLDVVSDRPLLLFAADVLVPGWSVTVDGRSGELMRANGVFRAIPVTAGAHRVEMVYRPPGLYLGFALAVLAVVSLAAVILGARKTSRG